MTRPDSSHDQDERLADLADQILNKGIEELPVEGQDPEIRALADTLLRLKRAFPREEPDPARVKQMQKQVMRRWEQEKGNKSGWLEIIQQAWQSPSTRRQFGMAFAMIVMAGILILAAPAMFSGSGGTTGTAGLKTGSVVIWIVLILLGICLGWLTRRKP